MGRPAAALLALLCALPAGAAPAVRLGAREAEVELGPQALFLVDPGGRLEAADLLSGDAAGRLAPLGATVRGFGITTAAVWLRAEVESESAREWELVIDAALPARVDLFVEGPARHQHLRGGLEVRAAERDLRDAGPYQAARISFAAGERATLLVRASTEGPLYASLALFDPLALAARDRVVAVLIAFDAGIVLTLLLLSLYTFYALRDPWSPWFAGVFASFAGYQASTFGLLARLFPDSPRLALSSGTCFAAACSFCLIFYVRALVASPAHHPRLDRAARFLGLMMLAPMLLAPLAPAPMARAVAVIGLGTQAISAALGVAAVRRGDRPARFFVAAFALVLVTGLAVSLANLGVIPASLFSRYGLHVAVWLAGVILFSGLADRQAIEGRQHRALLEQLIEGRTLALRETIDRLQGEVVERQRAEAELREADERFRVAFDTSADAINLTRPADGQYVAVNQGFTKLVGFTAEEAVGRSSLALGLWVDPSARERMVEEVRRTGAALNVETSFRAKDGHQIVGLISAQLVKVHGETLLLTVTRDITARKRAEEERDRLQAQLLQAQKMEAIGQLAGGVAHDFNNLLTVITTNVALAQLDLREGDPAGQSLAEIEAAAVRAARLTRQLLAFSRRQVLEPRALDLGAQVAAMGSMLRRLIGEGFELAVDTPPGLAPVLADPGQVEQLLVNLVVNARDALPGRGRIEVSTRAVELDAAQAGAERRPGRYGVLEVADQGSGMSPEVRARIFEPFFTTKQGHGTGLGLSTVYGIVSQHGGFIEVETAEGRGTRFCVHLPEATGREAVRSPPALPSLVPQAPARCGTVLLVEDEEAVRESTRALIERLGHRVLAARDGPEALAISDAHPGAIDVLLTDVVMPRMNGRELAVEARRRRPGLQIIYMSGYSQEVVAHSGVLEEGLVLLHKPFSPQRLAAVLADALRAAEVSPPAEAAR